jgi:DNA-binding SARP family transcriptional activator
METAQPLSLTLFGSTLFHTAGRPFDLGIKGRTLELLLYLLVHAGQGVRRECAADRFWQDSTSERQRSALNSAIWRIGKKLPRHPGLRLNATDTTLRMTIDHAIPHDARDLCEAVRDACGARTLTETAASRLEAALAATDAPFIDGFDADWALAERERISNIRIRGMIALMHWYGGNRDYEDALEIGRNLLHEDPFREAVQIDIMWLYVLNGQRVQAIKQFETFASLLRRELGIEPMRETRALYHHIRNGLDSAVSGTDAPTASLLDSGNAQDSLALGLAAAEQSRRDFYQALRAQLG